MMDDLPMTFRFVMTCLLQERLCYGVIKHIRTRDDVLSHIRRDLFDVMEKWMVDISLNQPKRFVSKKK